jgi:PAS domain S-box-containing protein
MDSTDNSTLYRSYFLESPVAVFVTNTDGEYIDVNPAACEMVGYSREELLEMSVVDLTPTADSFEDLTTFFDIQEQDRARTETVLRHNEGHEIDVILDAVLIGDRIVGYVQEITERKEYERELERREAKYRSLFEDTRDAVMVLDRDGYLDCNEKTLELFGLDSVDEFIELTPWELSPETQPDGTDSKQAALAHIETAFEAGEAFFEWTHKRSDGTEFPAEVKLSRFQLEGDPAVHTLVRDITERKEYETRLQESEQRHRSMITAVDTSPVGTFILDEDFTVAWLNQSVEEFFGVDRDELIGTDKPTVVESDLKYRFDDPDRFETTLLASYEDNDYVESFECHVLPDEDRAERWLMHWSTPITQGQYAGGRIEHYTDITERKQYENELEEQRDGLDLLNQVVRHDIRNDMNVIRGRTTLLEEYIEEEAGLENLNAVQEATESAIDLTKTARDLSETMLSTADDVEAVSLDHHLRTPIEDLQSTSENAILTVDETLPDVRVRGNELLEAVFRNIIQNAVVHNDKEIPEVTVSTAREDATVTVKIADNGPGIPDEQKETVFGKGEKLDSPGTGVGLYLVQTLVDQYGGDVWVEDNDPEGAVFVVELPIAE